MPGSQEILQQQGSPDRERRSQDVGNSVGETAKSEEKRGYSDRIGDAWGRLQNERTARKNLMENGSFNYGSKSSSSDHNHSEDLKNAVKKVRRAERDVLKTFFGRDKRSEAPKGRK